jgi:hypothetical protein
MNFPHINARTDILMDWIAVMYMRLEHDTASLLALEERIKEAKRG